MVCCLSVVGTKQIASCEVRKKEALYECCVSPHLQASRFIAIYLFAGRERDVFFRPKSNRVYAMPSRFLSKTQMCQIRWRSETSTRSLGRRETHSSHSPNIWKVRQHISYKKLRGRPAIGAWRALYFGLMRLSYQQKFLILCWVTITKYRRETDAIIRHQ